MGELTERKFSVLAYSMLRRGTAHQTSQAAVEPKLPREDEHPAFQRCVEEIRTYLVASRGKTEEERQQYSESLNRAVLGFEEERVRFVAIINDQLAKRRLNHIVPPNRRYATLAEAVFAEVIGMNVLELLLQDRDGLEEIQVVGTDIFEVRGGRAIPSPHKFQHVKEVERIQQNLVLFNNEVINPRKRWAEVSLKDGSRVTLTGFGFTAEPTMTIRFYTMRYYNLHTLCHPDYETMDETIRTVLLCLLRCYFNMVVIGPTNSGKTNLIKAMIAELPDHERIVTIETRHELMLKRDFPNKNIIEYEVSEDDSVHSGNQAFKLALRQSPKRICHAEIRDDDANVYVRACTRGHEGSVTSVHVNELEDAPEAITDMCMLDGRGMNPERLTKRITEYVTQIGLEMGLVDGKRKLLRIGEYGYENGEVKVRDIVRYDFTSRKWRFPQPFSNRAVMRMMKYDPEQCRVLQTMGLIERC
ncbi:ATPase, T2SS/T4P/T4SS family [Paenibacillus mesophilus]|uniref:ATPase, T2SS/T4P/T4SS family n=1 Tax=Paenibacillus mesophilus TaxID=2582849 RepID=UPI00192E40B1|nr:ATPase, T2SS/T4P/T4SS family [Paenibacillus mesophilus]